MTLLNRFKKKTKLKKDIKLAEYFDPYYHGGDIYRASQHCVIKRVVIPGGPQGYTTIEIPSTIKTKEALFEYLVKEHHYKLPPSKTKAVDNSKNRTVENQRISTFLLNKSELGWWLCQLESGDIVLITDCYDTNTNWLHLVVVDKTDVDFVTHYSGYGYELSNMLVSKYPFEKIISRQALLEHHTITHIRV